MSTRQLLFSICALLLIIPLTHAQYILTLDFSGMDPYIGLQSEVRVTDMNTGKEVGRRVVRVIESADYAFGLYVLVQGGNYAVDIYADVNNNWMYDAPPTDHAWRRMVTNATSDVTLNFSPDDNYTDVGIGPVFPYSTYGAVWGGHWRNQTFGSTDTIQSTFRIDCDSIFATVKTSGVFGNPDTVMFALSDAFMSFDPVSDTITFNVPPPWMGSVYSINGEMHGNMSLFGTGLQFTGTMGQTQILGLYTVLAGGNPFANGYFVVRELNVTENTAAIELTGSTTDVTCTGAMDGVAAVQASGGHPGYTYLWSTGDTTAVISGLGPGEMSVTVTDAEGCTDTAAFTIYEPAAIVISVTGMDASCNGVCDGTIMVSISGGVPPYSYTWSHGSTEMNPGGLCGGDYSVTATDVTGCMMTADVVIQEPEAIVIDSVQIVHATDGQDNGVITIYAGGGVPPFDYALDAGAFVSSNSFSGLGAGMHTVAIRDANGCILEEASEILNMTGISEPGTTFDVFPNPARTLLMIRADAPVSCTLSDLCGKALGLSVASQSHLIDVSVYAPGLYMLMVFDGKSKFCEKIVIQ